MIEDSDGKELYSFKNRGSGFGAANILKCTITRSRKEEEEETVDVFYATLPIVTVVIENENSIINIKNGTGYQFVQYSSGGLNPQYNDLIPFELEVYDNNNDITETLKYNWKTIGQIQVYDNENKEFKTIKDTSFNIIEVEDEQEKDEQETEQKNIIPYKIKAQAYQSYNGLNVTNGISCLINNKNNKEYAFINIPIHCYLNRYAFANLNVWDGNSIQIDENGGYILTPQIGAGHKDKDTNTNTNTFTGLLMGDVKESSWTEKQTGLFGYNQGKRTLFLDSETGGAIFGPKEAQITIGPNTDKRLMIYSSDFWKSDNFNEKGFLKSFNYSYILNKTNPSKPTFNWSGGDGNGKGLLIDFNQDKPAIIFGNGNFSVQDGILKAKDAYLKGSITILDKADQEIAKITRQSFTMTYSPDVSEPGDPSTCYKIGNLCIDSQKVGTNTAKSSTRYGMMLFANTAHQVVDYIGLGYYQNYNNNRWSGRKYPLLYAQTNLFYENTDNIWAYKGLNFKDMSHFWSSCTFNQRCYFNSRIDIKSDITINTSRPILINCTRKHYPTDEKTEICLGNIPIYDVCPKTVSDPSINYYCNTYTGYITDLNGKTFKVLNGLICN